MNTLPMSDEQREHIAEEVRIRMNGGCFMTWCPFCRTDAKLYVTRAKICATGRTLKFHSHLEPDGFVVPSGEIISGTDNERVKCEGCGRTFGLARVIIRLR